MTTYSKVLMEFFKTSDCCDIVHSRSCTVNAFYLVYRFFISNAKYYAPIIALPAIAKFRHLNRKTIEDVLRYYFECVITGTAIGWTTAASLCFFRNLLGEFKYYTFLFVPTIIASLNVYWSTSRVQRMHVLSILQSTVESVLMRRQNIFTKTIANSIFVQTLLFMTSSSIILQAKQVGLYKGFWLLTPDKSSNTCKSDKELLSSDNATKLCTHKEKSCFLHLIKGVRSYFAFGITLDFLKALISSVPKHTNGFRNKLFAKLEHFKFNSAALLASYIGIYRFSYCFLNRKTPANATFNHITAGFLSGACFIFMPKLTWLSYALVLSVQILWKIFVSQKKFKKNDNKLLNIFLGLSYGKLFYTFCLAHLVHTYCFRISKTSNLAQIIVNNTTDFYAQNILIRMTNLDKFLTT